MVTQEFMKLFGVGSNHAHMLYNAGCRNINDIEKSKLLTWQQRVIDYNIYYYNIGCN